MRRKRATKFVTSDEMTLCEFYGAILLFWNESSTEVGLAPFQDGRHSSKMAAMAPIQDGVQTQLRVTTSDDPMTRSVSPRKVS